MRTNGALICLSIAVILAAALNYCTLDSMRKETLEYRTRFFEQLMGLPPSRVVFGDIDGCGDVGWREGANGLGGESIIWYSLDTSCDPFDTALEQVCRLRWKHEQVDLSEGQQAGEVSACMASYKERLRAPGRHRNPLAR